MPVAPPRPVLVRVQAGLSGRVEVKCRAVESAELPPRRRPRSCVGSCLLFLLRLLGLGAVLLTLLLAYDVRMKVQRDPLRGGPVRAYLSRIVSDRSEVWRAVGQELAQRSAKEVERLQQNKNKTTAAAAEDRTAETFALNS